eukprot:gb/GFBE01073568.1/.p1 GENE.gb/GFBE01073568.1/~~gb/GFBE01073568.1/.p1  ORF type:complete len:422 (+),score=76.50 gb/GFBE01073568.1/:1-1266(+)
MAAEGPPAPSASAVSALRSMFDQAPSGKQQGGKRLADLSTDIGRTAFGFAQERLESFDGTYEGTFSVKVRHGKGHLELNKPLTVFEGQFQNDKFDGKGVLKRQDGSSYVGQWKCGQKHGLGVKSRDGTSYDGKWDDGLRHGAGCQKYVNGDRYSGTWWRGQCSGIGTYYFEDGAQFHGAWGNGRYDGVGFHYGPNKERERLTFDQGVLVQREILTPASPPKTKGRPTVNKGKVRDSQLKQDMIRSTEFDAGPVYRYLTVKDSTVLDLSAPSVRRRNLPPLTPEKTSPVRGMPPLGEEEQPRRDMDDIREDTADAVRALIVAEDEDFQIFGLCSWGEDVADEEVHEILSGAQVSCEEEQPQRPMDDIRQDAAEALHALVAADDEDAHSAALHSWDELGADEEVHEILSGTHLSCDSIPVEVL